MNVISPKKLFNTKWTAVKPENKEKHFLVSRVKFDDTGKISVCEIEAVMNKSVRSIDWRELKNPDKWRQGWQ